MKHWRGDYVIVFPGNEWKFHTCAVVCGRKLTFGTESSKTGLGPECARKSTELVTAAKERALEGDRLRYRTEVLDLGFKIDRPTSRVRTSRAEGVETATTAIIAVAGVAPVTRHEGVSSSRR